MTGVSGRDAALEFAVNEVTWKDSKRRRPQPRQARVDECPKNGEHCEHYADGRRPCCHCGASPR